MRHVPGSATPRRDLILDLSLALSLRGLRLMLYVRPPAIVDIM